jgi:hypothetical protein
MVDVFSFEQFACECVVMCMSVCVITPAQQNPVLIDRAHFFYNGTAE